MEFAEPFAVALGDLSGVAVGGEDLEGTPCCTFFGEVEVEGGFGGLFEVVTGGFEAGEDFGILRVLGHFRGLCASGFFYALTRGLGGSFAAGDEGKEEGEDE